MGRLTHLFTFLAVAGMRATAIASNTYTARAGRPER
jgi:hypothetical protein